MDKVKYTLEFDMKSIPVALLWTYISTANGLRQWFADDVKIEGKEWSFVWKSYSQEACLVGIRSGAYVRFRWNEDDAHKTYFEMRISVNELTDSTVLVITDFSDEEELDDSRDLWISQTDKLRRVLGCL